MKGPQCPIPQVEAALAPYIHPWEETRRIRREIAQHLSPPLEAGVTRNLSLNHSSPLLTVADEPDGLERIHKRYYDALRANIAARQSYERIREEIEGINSENGAMSSAARDRTAAKKSVRNYIEAQRQKQQHAKLHIIQETLGELTEKAPRALHEDLGSILREEVGERPTTPHSSLGAGTEDGRLNEEAFKLKRSLLIAKSMVHHSEHSQAETAEQLKRLPEPTIQAQIYALRFVRDDLIAWIEEELAKISETEDDSSIMEPEAGSSALDAQTELPSEDEIVRQTQELYDNYVEARKKLAHNVDNAIEAVRHREPISAPLLIGTTEAMGQTKPTAVALTFGDLVTSVPSLVQMARNERTLTQQTSYLRRQLAAASDETRATTQRLSGESYLVAPDAESMEAWALAAATKSRETEAFVTEKLEIANASLRAVEENLNRVEGKNRALYEIKGDL